MQCCESLVDALGLTKESSAPVVPRILYLDNYIYSNDKSNWEWPNGARMHVLGSLILQSVFRFPSVCVLFQQLILYRNFSCKPVTMFQLVSFATNCSKLCNCYQFFQLSPPPCPYKNHCIAITHILVIESNS